MVAIFTAADIEADNLGGVPCGWLVTGRDDKPMDEPKHPILASGKVRHVGDPDGRRRRRNLAPGARTRPRRSSIDYQELPAVVDMKKALAGGGAAVHDEAPNNLCFDWELRRQGRRSRPPSPRPRTSRKLDLVNNRLVPNAMEPRAAIGDYDIVDRRATRSYTTSQNPHVIRLLMGAFVLNIPEHKLRVYAPDVGGGFGSKIYHYAEEALVTWGAKKIGRPVKWVAERSESFVSDAHGRDHVTHVEMAFDKDGKIDRPQGRDARQPRRLSVDLRALRADVAARHAARRSVHDAGDLREREGGVHQHRAGRRLSRRRPARGDLSCSSA